MLALAAPLMLGASEPASLDVSITGLRNETGSVRLCLTRDPHYFPDCSADPDKHALTVPAGSAAHFAALASGTYALSVFHDENGNARLDTFLAIPREGFGFSQNPPLRFGPPAFSAARFEIQSGEVRQTIRLRYIL